MLCPCTLPPSLHNHIGLKVSRQLIISITNITDNLEYSQERMAPEKFMSATDSQPILALSFPSGLFGISVVASEPLRYVVRLTFSSAHPIYFVQHSILDSRPSSIAVYNPKKWPLEKDFFQHTLPCSK